MNKVNDAEHGKVIIEDDPTNWGKIIAMILAFGVLVAACAVSWVFQNWQTSLMVFGILVFVYLIVFNLKWIYVALRTFTRDMS